MRTAASGHRCPAAPSPALPKSMGTLLLAPVASGIHPLASPYSEEGRDFRQVLTDSRGFAVTRASDFTSGKAGLHD